MARVAHDVCQSTVVLGTEVIFKKKKEIPEMTGAAHDVPPTYVNPPSYWMTTFSLNDAMSGIARPEAL